MDVSFILDGLNERQREAVTAPEQPVLVLAGAGSGKTRVLVHRAAWLMRVQGVSPQGLLAVTFTNKAAAEMRGRIEALLGMPAANLWVGTFHGLAHRLLRIHWREAGLVQGFQILDSEDQLRLIKRMVKSMDLEDSSVEPKELRAFINKQKDEGRRPEHLEAYNDHTQRQFVSLYKTYEETCERSGLVDFAELLLRAHELWLNNDELLAHYRNRFSHLLVDEFQDTNTIQYAWLRVLAGNSGLPFFVGDDDQSIYGWRGARIEHLHHFARHFPNTLTVRLEQNYRSTGTILKAANALIANNSERMGKELWTAGDDGEPISVYSAFNERDEAEFVVGRVRDWVGQGGRRDEVAVLYRSNAQSRSFEEALINAGMPYRVYGGLRFFERAEIKDALAYLRLIENRDDDASFERVVNLPTRGIGARSVELLRAYARANATSMWRAAGAMIGDGLTRRAANAVHGFLRLIESLAESTHGYELHEQVDTVIQRSGLIEHFEKDGSERGQARVENLQELVTAARGFTAEDDDLSTLALFLSHAALEAGEGQSTDSSDCLQLMTMHSAKGLEFSIVFMCGLEEGLFPHRRSVGDASGMEEERRLCYVGTTRAMKKLYLTHAEQRRLHGVDNRSFPSRFINELPPELLEEVRPSLSISRPIQQPASPASTTGAAFKLGQRVRHGKFGDGIVLNCEGHGAHTRLQVNFETEGTKWLVMAYANLEVL
ncbi:MAG: DNA helicase II [Pseudomonadota bacterium]